MCERLFAPEAPAGGRRRFDRLTPFDGHTIALSLSLVRNLVQSFFWKSTYDERFAKLAPGILLEDAILHESEGMVALKFLRPAEDRPQDDLS